MFAQRMSVIVTLAAVAIGSAAVSAKPVSYKLPDETAALKPGPNPRGGAEQLCGFATRWITSRPSRRAEVQEGFLAGRSHQDDQGVRRADRRRRCRQDRRLPDTELLIAGQAAVR